MRRPSSSSAQRRTSALVAGTTVPCTANTRLLAVIADSRLPVIAVSAERNRLPKLWPSRPVPARKRYWNSRVSRGSSVARAARQLRMSPGGSTPSSRRSTPELPPSSATVTMAVRLEL